MAKKKSSAALSHGETVAGLIFLALYLFVLPLVKAPAFRLAEKLLGVELSGSLENAVYYYLLFAVTVVIFHGFLCRTSGRLHARNPLVTSVTRTPQLTRSTSLRNWMPNRRRNEV